MSSTACFSETRDPCRLNCSTCMGIAFRVQDLSRIYLDRSFRLADQNISFQLHRLLVHSQHLSFQHELIRNVIS